MNIINIKVLHKYKKYNFKGYKVMLNFINGQHKENFIELIKRDSTFKGDCYRIPFFYLLSTNLTFDKIDIIYDFETGMLTGFEVADKFYSSSVRRLIRFAINLFSNHTIENQESIIETFSAFDNERYVVAMRSLDMRIRYDKYEKEVEEFFTENNLNHKYARMF